MTRQIASAVLLLHIVPLLGARAAPTAETAVAEAPAVPRILCEEATFNFGERDATEVVEHSFLIRNVGNAPLVISKVKPGCGCTVTSWRTKTLAAGESSELTSKLRLKGMRGKQKKSITVESNDPKRPRLYLSLAGSVSTALYLDPSYANFGALGRDQVKSETIKLVSRTPGVKITGVNKGKPDWLTVKILEEGHKSYPGLILTTKPPLGPGALRGSILVDTNSKVGKQQRLLAYGHVQGALTTIPRTLLLRGDPTHMMTRSILVRPGTVKSFKVLDVAVPDPLIGVKVAETSKSVYRIDLSDLSPRPELNGKEIRILTDAAEMGVIKVPITVGK